MDANRRVGRPPAGPTVVVDRVSMQYRVTSSEAHVSGDSAGLGGRLRRSVLAKGTKVTVRALNEISLVVERGESVGVIGTNGSGKSTLTRLISGQGKPTSGSIHASSTPIMLGVNAALIPELSGEQNIVLGCLAMGVSYAEIEDRFDAIVELSGLDKAIHLPMRSYSSGMSSRLRFAIAASIDPEILVIDEALNTGDAQFRERSRQRMDELRSQAGTVFLVSHSLGVIRDICTRVLWLDKGDLVMDGDPETVTKAYGDYTRQLSKGNGDSAARLRREARAELVVASISDTGPERPRT